MEPMLLVRLKTVVGFLVTLVLLILLVVGLLSASPTKPTGPIEPSMTTTVPCSAPHDQQPVKPAVP